MKGAPFHMSRNAFFARTCGSAHTKRRYAPGRICALRAREKIVRTAVDNAFDFGYNRTYTGRQIFWQSMFACLRESLMVTVRAFLKYVLPSMLAFALSGVYSIADGFFVGNQLGDNALAAVNIAYPITAFIQAAGTGIGMGGAIRFAIAAGGTAPESRHKYFAASCILLAAASVLLTAVFAFASAPLIRLFGAEGDTYALAEEYIRVIVWGAVLQIFGTGLVPFIRNMGGSVAAMAAMIAGFVTNIVLDYVFVWVTGWGMTGAAAATVIGQAATLIVCAGYLIAKKQKLSLRLGKGAGRLMRQILLIGLSPFGLTFSPNITLILVNKFAAISGGEFAVACYATVSYISCVVLLLLQGISDGSQPLMSQYFGEGNEQSAKRVRTYGFIFAAATAVVCCIALFFAREYMAGLFGASAEVSNEVAKILPLFTAGYLFAGVTRMTAAYFYATDKSWRAYILIFGEPAMLLILLLFMPALLGVWGTWISVPLSQVVISIVSAVFLFIFRTKKSGSTESKQNV